MKTETLSTFRLFTVYRIADIVVALFVLIACCPLLVLSGLRSAIAGKPLLRHFHTIDCLNRSLRLTQLNSPPMTLLGQFFDLLRGEVSLCGFEIISAANKSTFSVDRSPAIASDIKSGIFSLTALHRASGFAVYKNNELIYQTVDNWSFRLYLLIVLKSLIASVLFGTTSLRSPKTFRLFGLRINNVSMTEAVNWAVTVRTARPMGVGVFVNVNSVNLAVKQPALHKAINCADQVFADGSGVRLGARHHGIALRDNVNGTDLLPALCSAARAHSLSLYLLGGAPGIAAQAAERLQGQFPGLRIAGTHHGYFNKQGGESENVVAQINQSGADIVLVGFGSPVQEQWLLEYRDQFTANTALAVGGLFDFFSGAIPRAPEWMRELGIEWLWRLMQEPGAKWRRYVLGNPLYLFRLWFLCED